MSTSAEDVLRGLSLFCRLSDAALQAVASRSAIRTLKQEGFLFRKGQPCRGLHVVVEGSVRVFRSSRDTREQVLHTQGSGQALAEVPRLGHGPPPLQPAEPSAQDRHDAEGQGRAHDAPDQLRAQLDLGGVATAAGDREPLRSFVASVRTVRGSP